MIVNDDTVSKALAYLAEDPHPMALARKDMTDAENDRDRQFAEFFLDRTGSVRERECAVEALELYQSFKDRVTKAAFELDRHKQRTKAAEMIIEVWRSENANIRAAERVR